MNTVEVTYCLDLESVTYKAEVTESILVFTLFLVSYSSLYKVESTKVIVSPESAILIELKSNISCDLVNWLNLNTELKFKLVRILLDPYIFVSSHLFSHPCKMLAVIIINNFKRKVDFFMLAKYEFWLCIDNNTNLEQPTPNFFPKFQFHGNLDVKKIEIPPMPPPNIKTPKSISGIFDELSLGLYNNLFVTPNSWYIKINGRSKLSRCPPPFRESILIKTSFLKIILLLRLIPEITWCILFALIRYSIFNECLMIYKK